MVSVKVTCDTGSTFFEWYLAKLEVTAMIALDGLTRIID